MAQWQRARPTVRSGWLALVLVVVLLAGVVPVRAGEDAAAAAACVGHERSGSVVDGVQLVLDDCAGIRPGAWLSDGVRSCTMNFLFTNDTDLFVGTAGHCVKDDDRVFASGVGAFGTVVYDGQPGIDFALVQIDADKRALADPSTCAWGGPLAVREGDAGPGEVLYEYGWGVATLATPATRARVLVHEAQSDAWARWTGIGSSGDSGAPVLDAAGAAFAVHTSGLTPQVGVVREGGPTIVNVLDVLADAGFEVTLVTATTWHGAGSVDAVALALH